MLLAPICDGNVYGVVESIPEIELVGWWSVMAHSCDSDADCYSDYETPFLDDYIGSGGYEIVDNPNGIIDADY